MRFMSGNEYAQLTQGATELMRDGHGVKVLQIPNGQIVKLIRIKRWYSLSAIYPYSVRFQRNAKCLRAMGIPSVEVQDVFYCHKIRRHGVIYPMLQGESLEKIASQDGISAALFQTLADFIAMLHAKGVYFRSLHLGNVLLLPNGSMGLIDVADMRFSRSALRLDQRKRNFRHLLRNRRHLEIFQHFGLERFLKLYSEAAALPQVKAGRIMELADDLQD